MSYRFYFDLTLASDQPKRARFDQMGALIHQLHLAHANSGVPFAISFPYWMKDGFGFGSKLRVWSTSDAQVNEIYDAWDALPVEIKLADGGRVRSVNLTDTHRFECFMMQRLPSGISKRETDIPREQRLEMQARARARRIAQQAALPFVPMRSSRGHRFRLVIDRIVDIPKEQGQPNGYGLSRKTQIVALPIVP